ncbi:MAG: GGDEF domain-containing protein [Candidatus Fermentibacteraceae bacterium]|nr:GGDEF domain-containing protein [Candidatus Fermentibacteraceae bacterium]MBN2608792.1 GGDEF domain-containing protein [Candidatus Fermentibacteraceae bacterium]
MSEVQRTRAIIDSAFSTEKLARDLYALFASRTEDPELRLFWSQLSDDEGSHLEFWKGLTEMSGILPFAMMIDDPDALLATLEKTMGIASEVVEELRNDPEKRISVTDSLMTAYRLEFYMLDSSFQTLFQSLRFLQNDFDPVREYDEHIGRFAKGLNEFGAGRLETELLSETLSRLWSENTRLAAQTLEDSLTGALNRRGFFTMGAQICALMRRRHSPVGLLMLDLDRFKQLNDSRGHTQGDLALAHTVRTLRGMLRESDLICRYGGDEFIVLLPDTLNTEAVSRKIMTGLNDSLRETFGISVTAGLAQGLIDCDRVVDCLNGLLRKADEDLCRLKARARD